MVFQSTREKKLSAWLVENNDVIGQDFKMILFKRKFVEMLIEETRQRRVKTKKIVFLQAWVRSLIKDKQKVLLRAGQRKI